MNSPQVVSQLSLTIKGHILNPFSHIVILPKQYLHVIDTFSFGLLVGVSPAYKNVHGRRFFCEAQRRQILALWVGDWNEIPEENAMSPYFGWCRGRCHK